MLLRLFDPAVTNTVAMPFDRILKAVADGAVTAGLIIHESRFTYPLYRLESLADLGTWWEQHTALPLPLGAILGKRALGSETLLAVERAIRDSLRYARDHEAEVLRYCREHSQEMDEAVMRKHIDLYVNDFTLDLGAEGIAAVRRLFAEADARGMFPRSERDLFADPA
jgi:1,4-dihydroxy-6-naphthoate synthase